MKAPRQAPERKSATRLNFSMEEGSKLRSLSRQPKKIMLLGPFRSNMADILGQKYQMIYIPTHGIRTLCSILSGRTGTDWRRRAVCSWTSPPSYGPASGSGSSRRGWGPPPCSQHRRRPGRHYWTRTSLSQSGLSCTVQTSRTSEPWWHSSASEAAGFHGKGWGFPQL